MKPSSTSMLPKDTASCGDVDMLCDLASGHIVFGLHSTAIKLLNFACWIEPNDIKPMRILIGAYFAEGKSEKVVETVKRLYQIEPNLTLTSDESILLGRSLAILGDIDSSRRILMSIDSENIGAK